MAVSRQDSHDFTRVGPGTVIGDIDTSHVGFLHLGSPQPADLPAAHPMRPALENRSPQYEVAGTDWGTMHGGYRPHDDGRTSWRVACPRSLTVTSLAGQSGGTVASAHYAAAKAGATMLTKYFAQLPASDRGGFFVGATLDLNGGLYLR